MEFDNLMKQDFIKLMYTNQLAYNTIFLKHKYLNKRGIQ